MTDLDRRVLRIDIGLDDPSFGRVIEIQERFLSLIREVAGDVVGGASDVRWVVADVRADSLDLLVRAEPARKNVPADLMPEVVATITRGLRALEREAHRPPHFTDAALLQASELAKLRGSGVTKLQVRSLDVDVAVTTRTVANVEEVVGRTISAIGTVEGRLEALNVHGGERVFYVWDPVRGRVRCDFGRRIPSSEVGQAIEQRVAVTGAIQYRENGAIVGIRATKLVLLEPPDGLPSADSVRGILAAH